MDLELWLVSGYKGEDIPDSGDQRVHIQVDVIAAEKEIRLSPVPILRGARHLLPPYSIGQVLGTLACCRT